MFGYATDETDELMPMPILLAHRLTEALATRRKQGDIEWLRPDGKAQVTVVYEDKQPVAVDTVVISTQHAPGVTTKAIRSTIIEEVIEPTIPAELRDGQDQVSHQSNRPLRRRRSAGRCGPHRPQDHRRHVRRHGAARRWRVQRQRSVEGGPLGVLRGALGREEHRRRQARASMRGSARVRDRRRRAGVGHGRYVRDVHRARVGDHGRCGRACSISRREASSMRSTCESRSIARPRPMATLVERRGRSGRESPR